MAANQAQGFPLSVTLKNLQVNARSFGSLKPVGGFVQTQALNGLAGDRDDPVTALQTGFPRRTTPDDSDQA